MRGVVSDPKGDARELFRRIVFNALISNIDDHPRNHALIAPGRDWMLSPAYDLTPAPLISQAMQSGEQAPFANAENILSQHARFLLEREEAEKIITEMQAQISKTWEQTVLASGVSQRDAGAIRSAFVYPGFLR
jgi:serine/threonine-protein kinase HipA